MHPVLPIDKVYIEHNHDYDGNYLPPDLNKIKMIDLMVQMVDPMIQLVDPMVQMVVPMVQMIDLIVMVQDG